MFKRSGEKVKSVAKTIFNINIFIATIICLGGIITSSNMGYGGSTILLLSVVVSAIIVLIAWVLSLFMSAFGDLVNSNERIQELLEYKILEIGDKKELLKKITISKTETELLEQKIPNSENQNILSNTANKSNSNQNMESYIVYYKDGNTIQNLEINVPQDLKYEEMVEMIEKDKSIKNILSITKK